MKTLIETRNALSAAARKSWGDEIVRAKRVAAIRAAARLRHRSRVTVNRANRIKAIATRADQSTKVEGALPDFKGPTKATKIVADLVAAGEITSAHGVARTGSALRSAGLAASRGEATLHEKQLAERSRLAADKFGAIPIKFESVPAGPWSWANAAKNSALYLQRAASSRSSGGASSIV